MQKHSRRSVQPAAYAAAIAFVAGIGATIPAIAADTAVPRVHVILAAADPVAPAAASTSQPAENVTHMDNKVEDRIRDLHMRLGITAAQEDAWKKVAEVMRDNAHTMAGLIQTRSEKGQTMTAVDDLKSYAEIAKAHADGIDRFTPVFAALYDSMPDDQKKKADSIFRARSHHGMKHMGARHEGG